MARPENVAQQGFSKSSIEGRYYSVFRYRFGNSPDKRDRVAALDKKLHLREFEFLRKRREGSSALQTRLLMPFEADVLGVFRAVFRRLSRRHMVVRGRYVIQLDALVTIEESSEEDALPIIVSGNKPFKCPYCLPLFNRVAGIDPRACFQRALPLVASNFLPIVRESQTGVRRLYYLRPWLCERTNQVYLIQFGFTRERPFKTTANCPSCSSTQIYRLQFPNKLPETRCLSCSEELGDIPARHTAQCPYCNSRSVVVLDFPDESSVTECLSCSNRLQEIPSATPQIQDYQFLVLPVLLRLSKPSNKSVEMLLCRTCVGLSSHCVFLFPRAHHDMPIDDVACVFATSGFPYIQATRFYGEQIGSDDMKYDYVA